MRTQKALVLGVFLLSTVMLKAQYNEIKTNALGLILGQYSITYERVLSEETSVKMDLQYYFPSETDIGYSALSIVPEFRFFFSPDFDADGWFVGGYLKYRYAVQENGYYVYDPSSPIANEYRDITLSGLAVGFSTGRKWVTRSGFVYEIHAGLGRFLFQNETVEGVLNPEDTGFDILPNVDARLGVVFGYRF